MNKYINVEELVNAFIYNEIDNKKQTVGEVIDSLPIMEIVHCGECIHREEYEEYDRIIDEFVDCSYCKRDGKTHDESWFCADGIRMGKYER